ncbi:MAG: hypothetical protein BWK76_09120 [Desulfobulbaceae bacterium A2]|nr:MAG: hypothetical protein BWK76_09120 [Desulfobulbaceae bacterium A2]
MSDIRLDVALVHYPVLDAQGQVSGSAVTNLDLHDIARAGRTYGVDTYWVVTPYEEQRRLVREIRAHWCEGRGGRVNPARAEALALIRDCADLATLWLETTRKWGVRPRVLATSARDQGATLSFAAAGKHLRAGEPTLLLFGTSWGLAPEALSQADGILPPIAGRGGYNHLAVRSAVSIVLDRLLGRGEEG